MLPAWLGLKGRVIDMGFSTITTAVLTYLGIPFLARYLTRRILIARKGDAWLRSVFPPRIGPPTLVARPFTIAASSP